MTPARAKALADDYRLTGNERIIFLYLAIHGAATVPDLLQEVYGHRADGGPVNATRALWVTVANLRRKIAPVARIDYTKRYTMTLLPRAIAGD